MPGSPTDAVKERIDIVALVSEYLPLKRAGSNFKARCPFHEEDTPSFIVSPSRQSFHCFGCGKHGDCFTWLMEREGMSFPEVLRVLAQRAGVPLTFDRPERREERERLRATLDLATIFYQRILLETSDGRAARAYLEGRGLTAETIKAWRVGFCPASATRMTEKASERGVDQTDLVGAGVLGQREGRTFEFFRSRILFPLADAHGSVVGLAGRVFEGAPPHSATRPSSSESQPSRDVPKYINSPETPLYLKSKVLYGLDRAKEAIRKERFAVLVEGYTDVIASHQAGVTNVVATAGTALTEEHLLLLRRFTDRLAFAFDADAAGDAATRRAIDLALGSGFLVSVVVLQGGKDPADLAVEHPDAWRRALETREDVFPVLLRRALAAHSVDAPEGTRALAADLLPVIARVPDAVVQGTYVQQLAAALKVDPRFVYDDLRRYRGMGNPTHANQGFAWGPGGKWARGTKDRRRAPSPAHSPQTPAVDPQLRREERFLTLLLGEPSLIPRTVSELPEGALAFPYTRALYAALTAWYARRRASRTDGTGGSAASGAQSPSYLAELRHAIPEDLQERVDALLLAVEVERDTPEWQPAQEAVALLRALLRAHLRRELQRRTDRLRVASSGGERAQLLKEVSAMTADLARAERVTLT